MSGSLNKVELIGNLGKDPEVRSFQSGGQVASFSLATSESWTDKQTGEKKERVQWHNISVFNEHLIEIIERYVTKGTKLYVEGQLETRKWQNKDGEDRYTTEVVLRPYNGRIIMLGGKDDGERKQSSGGSRKASRPPDDGGFGTSDDLDDSIPF